MGFFLTGKFHTGSGVAQGDRNLGKQKHTHMHTQNPTLSTDIQTQLISLHPTRHLETMRLLLEM